MMICADDFGLAPDVDEAILQLEMSSRQFVVFLNVKTNKVNILYRRKGESFGLMEPTVD